MNCLEDEDWSICREAVRTLGNIGNIAKEAVSKLSSLLEDKEITIRKEVAIALGKIKNPTSESISSLIKRLNDNNEDVRTESVKALGESGSDAFEAIPYLMESLKDISWTVRTASAMAISGIGKGTLKAIPNLISALSDKDWRVRYRVINTLSDIGEPAIPYLVELLDHKDKIMRNGAVEALGEIKPSDPDILEKISTLLNDKNEQIRGKTADSLRSIGEPAIPFIIKSYYKRFFTLNFKNILYIFIYLVVLALTGIFFGLIPMSFTFLTLYIMSGIVFIIMTFLYAIFLIVDIIKLILGDYVWFFKIIDTNSKRRLLLLSSIGGIGVSKEEPIQFAIKQLKNKKSYLRVEAARALGKIGSNSKDALHALEHALTDDSKSIVKREAALSIGKLGLISKEAVPTLINALKDEKRDVRWRASEALGIIGVNTEEVISNLTNLVHDKCDYVCESAILALDNLTEE
ncbi:MAG: HEAT repeat domain-containing protein [Candidatus Odinarchaeota archaeon]